MNTTPDPFQSIYPVYRIRALRDFGDVKAGDIGGYIESEKNLSHTGACWVYDDACICDDAIVKDNAKARGQAIVKMSAMLSENAELVGECYIQDSAHIHGNAKVGWEWDGTERYGWKNAKPTCVRDNAEISDHAEVFGEVIVDENAKVGDNARVEGKWPESSITKNHYRNYSIACVSGHAVVEGDTRITNTYVRDNAHIYGNAVVSGHPKMGGHAEIGGNTEICGDAKIMHNVKINGNAKIGGTAEIDEKVTIGHNANIQAPNDLYDLKALGKTSVAFKNQDGGVTIVHKGKTYPNAASLKEAATMDEKGDKALYAMERHFGIADTEFADAIADIHGLDLTL